jgi:hypothetical protein
MKFRSVQKKTHIWPKNFLFDFWLHYNRGISVVCSNVFKCVLKFFKNLVENNFFTHTLTLYFPTKLLYIESPTRSSVALGLPPIT